MSYQIQDATGFSYGLKIDSTNRAYVNSVQQTQEDFYVRQGHAYNVNTGTINLTDGSESGILYLLNNEDEDLIVGAYIYLLGNSTGGTTAEDHLVQVYKNPTTGTLISAGTAFTPVNRDFSSANTLTATINKGAQGKTVTNGTVAIESIFASSGRYSVPVQTVIAKGNSVAITVTPKATNSSMDVQIAMAVYLNKFGL